MGKKCCAPLSFNLMGAVLFFLVIGCARAVVSPTAQSSSPGETYPPATLDLSSITPAYPPDPIDFMSEPGQFSVTFPCCDLGRKSVTEFTVMAMWEGQPVRCTVIVVPEAGATWSVKYCDLSTGRFPALTAQEALDWARDDVLQGAKARLMQEYSLVGEFESRVPGRSITAEANMRGIQFDGTMRALVFFTGDRVYEVVAVVYNENWGNRLSMMEGFLASFYIHESLTIPFEPPVVTPTP